MNLKELESDIGNSILKHHQLDISSSESINSFKSHIESTYGGFDVLVNNAGVIHGLGPSDSQLSEAKGAGG